MDLSSNVQEINSAREIPNSHRSTRKSKLRDLREHLSEAISSLDSISKKVRIARKMVLHRRSKVTFYSLQRGIRGGVKTVGKSSPLSKCASVVKSQYSSAENDSRFSSPLSSNLNYMSAHLTTDNLADISPPFECQRSSSIHSTASPVPSPNSRKAPFAFTDIPASKTSLYPEDRNISQRGEGLSFY